MVAPSTKHKYVYNFRIPHHDTKSVIISRLGFDSLVVRINCLIRRAKEYNRSITNKNKYVGILGKMHE